MNDERQTGWAYLFWCLGLLGFCGIHRFYAGKWVTGLIWLFTGGLLFVGQLVDLILIPGTIERANHRTAVRSMVRERAEWARAMPTPR